MSRKAANDNAPTDDAPIRLARAIEYAFPAGGMTVSGLRQEHAKGRLKLELIAGKHFVTLAAIKEMRELCRVEVKGRIYGGMRNESRGLSSIATSVSEQDLAEAEILRLRKR